MCVVLLPYRFIVVSISVKTASEMSLTLHWWGVVKSFTFAHSFILLYDRSELSKGIGRFRELLRVIESRSTQNLRQVPLLCSSYVAVWFC